MTTEGSMTINKKTQDIHEKPQEAAQAAQQPDKTTSTHKVMPGNQKTQQKPTGGIPWRYMTKRQRKNRRRMNRLMELWPDLFSQETPKPLKVGIYDDLIQDVAVRGLPFGPGVLRAAVMSYTQCPRYYRALMAGGMRYDLKGQPCGEVTEQEQKDAETRLMMLKKRNREQHQGNDKKETQDNGQGQQS